MTIPINTQLAELHRDIGRLKARPEEWAARKVQVLEAVIESLQRLREIEQPSKRPPPTQQEIDEGRAYLDRVNSKRLASTPPAQPAEPDFNDELPPL